MIFRAGTLRLSRVLPRLEAEFSLKVPSPRLRAEVVLSNREGAAAAAAAAAAAPPPAEGFERTRSNT